MKRDELIEAFLEDSLTEEQMDLFEKEMKDPEFAEELQCALDLKGALYQKFSSDREGKSIEDSVLKNISDSSQEEDSILQLIQINEERDIRKKKRFTKFWYMAAAVHIFLLSLFIFYWPDKPIEGVAVVTVNNGENYIYRKGEKLLLKNGDAVLPGDEVITGRYGDLSINYKDSTVIRIPAESEVQINDHSSGKSVELIKGKILARVAKQPEGMPLTALASTKKVTVLGTFFILTLHDEKVLLDVREGKVEIMDVETKEKVQVSERQYVYFGQEDNSVNSLSGKVLKSGTPVYKSSLVNTANRKDSVNIIVDITGARDLYLIVSNADDGNGNDHSIWLNARLEKEDGSTFDLSKLKWQYAHAAWGKVQVGLGVWDDALMFNGKVQKNGILAHATSIIYYKIPAGYKYFKAEGALAETVEANTKASVFFEVYTKIPRKKLHSILMKSKK